MRKVDCKMVVELFLYMEIVQNKQKRNKEIYL